jgi:predicted amidohydrolase YtcJ
MTEVAEGSLLVRGARLPGASSVRIEGGRVVGTSIGDLRITGGRIDALGLDLGRRPGEEVLDAAGGAILPGLHDHHMHLRALAARARSVDVGPGSVAGAAAMAGALGAAAPGSDGWVRAVGYHESVAGELDRWVLDAMVPATPVRVQHRTGVMWVLNSPALAALGADGEDEAGIQRDASGTPTGRLFRLDDWLARRLPEAPDAAGSAIAELSETLASIGVTGLTDATPAATPAGLAEMAAWVADGRVRQRLHVMAPADLALPSHPRVSRGPQKFLLDDDRLPPFDELTVAIAGAHRAGVPVALHCVTAMQLAFATAALDEAGLHPADRLEHAAVVPADMVGRLARLGVTVVVNPGLLYERGDSYLAEVERRDQPDLLRAASLLDAGIRLAAGTDAPFGRPDPWSAVASAHRRLTRDGRVLGAGEAVDETAALALFAGAGGDPACPRQLVVGEPGDLVVLDGDGLPGPDDPGRAVAATVVGGRVVHHAG